MARRRFQRMHIHTLALGVDSQGMQTPAAYFAKGLNLR